MSQRRVLASSQIVPVFFREYIWILIIVIPIKTHRSVSDICAERYYFILKVKASLVSQNILIYDW